MSAVPADCHAPDNETVLDALTFAGGLIPTAEPKDIHLVRPRGGGKPAKVYKVDLEAIRDKGDTHGQLPDLPRRPPGRGAERRGQEDDRDRSTGRADADSHQFDLPGIIHAARSLQTSSPENHEAILKDLVEFWIQEMKAPRRGQARRANPPRGPDQAAPDQAQVGSAVRTDPRM